MCDISEPDFGSGLSYVERVARLEARGPAIEQGLVAPLSSARCSSLLILVALTSGRTLNLSQISVSTVGNELRAIRV